MAQKLLAASVPFLIALAGVLVACLWLTGHWIVAACTIASLLVVGWMCDRHGRRLLPRYPLSSVGWMEWWIVIPGSLAVFGAGLVIILAVCLEPSEKADVIPRKLLGAVAGATATFLTTLFVKAADDADDGWLGAHVKKQFQARYQRQNPSEAHQPGVIYFGAESEGERWVYSDPYGGVSGWSWSARRQRALAIEKRLGTSDQID